MTKLTDELNNHEASYNEERKLNRKIIRSFLKSVPKSRLVDVLKELKIIMRDWEKNGEKYYTK